MDLSFDRPPTRPWLKIVFGSKRGIDDAALFPSLEAEWSNAKATELAAYQKICGFGISEMLPITYPQVLATPLHMQLLASRAFPFKLMGLVHVGQSIRYHAPILEHEKMRIHVWVDGFRQVKRGGMFNLNTDVYVGTEKRWSASATTLTRHFKGHGQTEPRPPGPNLGQGAVGIRLAIPENLGRRYMSISGDFNFIHVHALLAKPFGFKRAIIHGMWSLAKGISHAPGELSHVDAAFLRPIFLPSDVDLSHERVGDNQFNAIFSDARQGKTHLWIRGTLREKSGA